FALRQLQTRMASSPEQVLTFLRDLAARAKPHAQKDIEELRAYAATRLGLDTLEPWDVAFVSERLRQERFDYSEEELKQYFPLSRVLEGLFEVLTRLFGIRMEHVAAPVWHPDVQVVQVRNRDDSVAGH